MKNIFKRLVFFYIIAGVIGYALFNAREYHIQFVDAYRPAASDLMACVPNGCKPGVLRDGILYYEHTLTLIKSANALNAIGYCFYQLRFYHHARVYFAKAVALNPDNFGFHFNLAAADARLHAFVSARKELSAAAARLKNVELFFAPDMLFSNINRPAEILNDRNLRVGYEWYYAKKQVDELTALLQTPQNGKMDNLTLYYYVPVFTINVNGQENRVL